MRKVLSIVLALLMVSMMIPSMAFAADDLSATGVPAVALVAGQSFDLTITSASANVTVKVNTNVFDLPGTEETVGKIGYITCAPGTITITVKTDIPTEEFTSSIRIEDEDEVLEKPVKVDDRLVGDVTNDDVVNISDITSIYVYLAGKIADSDTTFSAYAGNVTDDDVTNISDITAIYVYLAGKAGDNTATGKFANGTTDEVAKTADFEDPTSWETTTEPDPEPAKKLDAVEGLMAAAKEEKDTDGNVTSTTVYYDFDAVENASGYEVYINDVKIAELDADTTEGSYVVDAADVTLAKDGNDLIAVIAKGDTTNYTDSDKAETTFAVASASIALTQWLKENGLEDVVITVYEITAE